LNQLDSIGIIYFATINSSRLEVEGVSNAMSQVSSTTLEDFRRSTTSTWAKDGESAQNAEAVATSGIAQSTRSHQHSLVRYGAIRLAGRPNGQIGYDSNWRLLKCLSIDLFLLVIPRHEMSFGSSCKA
jgi:hypothetical protein